MVCGQLYTDTEAHTDTEAPTHPHTDHYFRRLKTGIRAGERMKDLFEYLESLAIGQGRYAGQLMQLFPWQKRFLKGAFCQPDDAALSLARGGGKTTFTSAIACAALAGPLAEPMAEVLIVASSFDQGLVNFRHILHFLKPAIEADPARWRIQDSANRATVTDRKTGAMLRVLGSDPRRLHGAAPKLILADEVAQWPDTQIDRMLAALETSRGKITGSKMLWLGTRAARPDHPFEAAFRQVGYAQVHAAPNTAPRFSARVGSGQIRASTGCPT